MSVKPLAFSQLKTVPLSQRQADAQERDFGAPFRAGGSFADFLCALPGLGVSGDLFLLRDAITTAFRNQQDVILGCGGHVFEAGLSPFLVRLIEQKLITGVALTGAAMLQDVEIALTGHTLQGKTNRITQETGLLINESIVAGAAQNKGIGYSIGTCLMETDAKHLDHSVLATACRFGVPITVHPAIGADMFNLHPLVHGESLGAAGMTDFRLLAGMMANASGGVLLNVASSVVIPRLFAQAAEAARNLEYHIDRVTVGVIEKKATSTSISGLCDAFDSGGGQTLCLTGAEEVMLPLLFAAVTDDLAEELDAYG
ncbi:MAG: hypothetical protein Q9M19_02210 [Mariprofundaceae bacterium]|nr:hypothetical protein [Mariprofundaceae bacterium]